MPQIQEEGLCIHVTSQTHHPRTQILNLWYKLSLSQQY